MSWSVPIDRLAARTKERLDTVVRKVTLDVWRSVVLKSPVDTGRFRANWNASFGLPDYSTSTITDQGRGLTEAARALRLPVGGITYLSNGLPYGLRLEHGYSKQAPVGMVKVTVAEFHAIVHKAVSQ